MGDSLPASYDRIVDAVANAVKKEPRQMKELGADYRPHENDVICARGKNAVMHPGNKLFRALVESKLEVYSKSDTKLEKGAIVTEVLAFMRHKSPDGGFVRCVNGRWMEVGDLIAREKTGQMFRDCLHTQYKSSTKAKNEQRKMKWKPNNVRGEEPNTTESDASFGMSTDTCTDISYRLLQTGESAAMTEKDENDLAKRRALSEVNPHAMDTDRNRNANSKGDPDHDIVLNKPESSTETALWSAMDEILPPANPDALHALSLVQLHLIRRLSLENQQSGSL